MSLGLDEPQFATASIVRNWIMLEQPGPWGYDAVVRSRMPRNVAREIRARGRALGVRVVLVRRPGRSAPRGSRCYFAHTGRSVQRLQHAFLPNGPIDLLDVDWEPLTEGEAVPDADVLARPLFLVCTNGARDPCCAERGRPVARALGAIYGDRAWECSHIGGDRFAGNVVCFPHGVYFGRVEPQEAAAVALAYEEGILDLDHYRGRSCHDFPTQAAEYFLRREGAFDGVDDVRLLERRVVGDGRVDVEFTVPGGSATVAILVRRSPDPRRLTCHGPPGQFPPVFRLLGVERVGVSRSR